MKLTYFLFFILIFAMISCAEDEDTVTDTAVTTVTCETADSVCFSVDGATAITYTLTPDTASPFQVDPAAGWEVDTTADPAPVNRLMMFSTYVAGSYTYPTMLSQFDGWDTFLFIEHPTSQMAAAGTYDCAADENCMIFYTPSGTADVYVAMPANITFTSASTVVTTYPTANGDTTTGTFTAKVCKAVDLSLQAADALDSTTCLNLIGAWNVTRDDN